jgi:hypothetical protein
VFEDLLKNCQALAAKQRRFRFKHPLRSLDASAIELCVAINVPRKVLESSLLIRRLAPNHREKENCTLFRYAGPVFV